MQTSDSHRLAVLVVDDHAIVRVGLKRLLEGISSEWSVQEAASSSAALEALRYDRFDIAIIDLSMPGMSGLELVRRARVASAELRMLVLSMHDEEQYAVRAFRAGANGYVTKDNATRELANAVRKVAGGGTYVSPGLAERLVLQMNGAVEAPPHHTLSDRELDVLRRMVSGHRVTDIAEALHLSVKTISTHKSRILEKLRLPNTAAMFRYAIEHGLVAD